MDDKLYQQHLRTAAEMRCTWLMLCKVLGPDSVHARDAHRIFDNYRQTFCKIY